MDVDDIARQTVSDSEDNVLEDTDCFYKEYGADLIQVQRDLTRFTSAVSAKNSGKGRFSVIPCLIAGIIAFIAGILFVKRRRNTADNK